mgnify:CR=1 FL=1
MAEKPATVKLTAEKSVGVAPAFKLVLFTVVGLTFVSYLGSILLLFAPHTDDTKSLIEAGSTIYKVGCGAIIGLLSGKVLP